MQDKFNITESELEIMQVLWTKGDSTLTGIVEELNKIKIRNKNTVKTLIYRLVDKGSVSSTKTDSYGFLYKAEIEENEYLKIESKNFLEKLYNGNFQKLVLNFVEDKSISKEELKKLVDMLESED